MIKITINLNLIIRRTLLILLKKDEGMNGYYLSQKLDLFEINGVRKDVILMIMFFK